MILILWRMACRVALLALMALPGWAQDVTLTSRDGSVEVTGTLISYDGEFYRLNSAYGVLTLDGQGVVCAGVGCPDLDAYVARFDFSGDPGIGATLLPALVEGFATARGFALTREITGVDTFRLVLSLPGQDRQMADIGFRLNSADQGFADLLDGQADLVMSMREVRTDEAAALAAAGLGDLTQPARARIVALDALVPVVAAGNLRRQIGMEELRAILSGQQADWPGLELPIALHLGAGDAGFGDLLQRKLRFEFGTARQLELTAYADAAELSDSVAADPLALGLVRRSEQGNARILSLIGDCGVMLPTDRHALMAEDYPLTAPLFLYTPAQRLPLLAREFLDYLTTPAAHRIVRGLGLVDLGWEAIPLALQGDRLTSAITHAGGEVSLADLQQMMQTLSGAARLTTTFRFRDGASALDAQSFGNIATLAQALETGAFDDRTLIFAGFSDGAGSADANRALSKTRAEAVRAAVRKAGFSADFSRVKMQVEGFGEAMPMACDDNAWGRSMNRRVEVWLR
ncbi:OmpA family protein [Actibacterium ureilyticum]|uniref:OmpA family protein n=1 Tax=Actibacterium ureilyticum TaxID=1590614 RepID=UPI001FE51CBA|nr:phosphate ABC transporter substrate-binding/OmpA family protein [Actibacterium ureilyticum]